VRPILPGRRSVQGGTGGLDRTVAEFLVNLDQRMKVLTNLVADFGSAHTRQGKQLG
jgi:hypothetical protein